MNLNKKSNKLIKFSNKNSVNKKYCVLCNSSKLKNALDFGKTPLANSYPKSINKKELKFKLITVICEDCGHLQLKNLINPKIMFQNYLYVSGTSGVLIRHFKGYAEKIIKKFKLNRDSKILDIACNDGTFLNFFKKKNFKLVVGIDPAKNLRSVNLKKKIRIITDFFNFKKSINMKKKFKYFDIITANNVFAHNPNLQDFTLGVKNILEKNGVFILEVSYLPTVIKKKTFDTIYHEHMSYHALKPLVSFFKSFNLEVFDFDLIEAQGGSIRVYVSHKNVKKINKKKIDKKIKKEIKKEIFKIKTYEKFYRYILFQKKKLRIILESLKSKNKMIIGYGAPAKLTTLSHVLNFNNKDFKIVIDDNFLKQNRYVPGSKFCIKNSKMLNHINNAEIIILAWNFFESIKRKCLSINKNFNFIKPFPYPKKINK